MHDPARLAALRATGLLDSPPEASFDRIAALAARLLSAPVATVTLVDAERQFYTACVGMPAELAERRETPLDVSFCRLTIADAALGALAAGDGSPGALVIPDTRLDPRTRDMASVTQLGVHAYAGVPILLDGQPIGTVCVMDLRARAWSADDVALLGDLGRAATTEIALRVANGRLAAAADASAALVMMLRAERAELAATTARGASLLSLASALAGARTVDDVARVVVDEGFAATGAVAGSLAVRLTGTNEAAMVRHGGFDPDVALDYARFPISLPGPTGHALRTGEPVFIESRDGDDGMRARFPWVADVWERMGVHAAATIPLVAAGQVVGATPLLFDAPRRFTDDDRAFFLAFGRQAAQALARAQLADEVADSFGLLDGVFASAPVGLAFFDRDLRYLRINEELARINGLPVSAHLGRRIEEVLPRIAGPVNAMFERVLATGEALRNLDLVEDRPAALGGVRHFKASYFPVRRGARADGEIIAVGTTAEDVTASVRAEADREFLFAFAAAMQQPGSADALFDEAQGRLVRYLGAARCIVTEMGDVDRRESSVRHDHVRGAGALTSGDILPDRPPSLIDEQVAGRTVVVDDTAADARTAAWHATHYAPIGVRALVSVPLVRRGQLVGSLAVTEDVPRAWSAREVELVQAAAARLWPAAEAARAFETERALRAAAEAARVEAEEARSGAEAANQAKSQFLANMSHELRTPLNAIGGYAELIALGIRGPVTDQQLGDLDRIRRSQQHLLGLITDVLNFAKLEAGRVEYDVRDVPLAPVLEDVELLVGPQARARGLVYDAPWPEAAPTGMAPDGMAPDGMAPDGMAPRRSAARRARGPRQAAADPREPPDERRQVHRHAGNDRGALSARRGRCIARRDLRARHRHRHPRRAALGDLRAVRAGRLAAHAVARRFGTRPRDQPRPGRGDGRDADRRERGGRRIDVHDHAACRCHGRRAAALSVESRRAVRSTLAPTRAETSLPTRSRSRPRALRPSPAPSRG